MLCVDMILNFFLCIFSDCCSFENRRYKNHVAWGSPSESEKRENWSFHERDSESGFDFCHASSIDLICLSTASFL